MVRNATSMHNLRGSMSDSNFNAPHPQREYEPSQRDAHRYAVSLPLPPQSGLLRTVASSNIPPAGAESAAEPPLQENMRDEIDMDRPRRTWWNNGLRRQMERERAPEIAGSSQRKSTQHVFGPDHLLVEPEFDEALNADHLESRSIWEHMKQEVVAQNADRPRFHARRKTAERIPQIPPKQPERSTGETGEMDQDSASNEIFEEERFPKATGSAAEIYSKPFCKFLTDNPTAFHAVDYQKTLLSQMGWTYLNEREAWDIEPGGKYFVERNGSSLIAFVVGANYKPGNGAAILAGHIDALTAKVKPISEVPNKAGYLQLGVAPYAGALNDTWWDRDLGIAGRVLVKEGDKIVTELVNLNWPIARIPTLAPHFGQAAAGPFNKETQMVPIIGLEDVDSSATPTQEADAFKNPSIIGGGRGPVGNFVNTQPKALVKAIGDAIGLNTSSYSNIVNWELELYDVQPATVGGLNKEFIYGGRIDDKLCSWAAMQALTGSQLYDTRFSSLIKVVGWFDNEEIGSQLRQGAKSNFLPQVIERAVGSLSRHSPSSDLLGRTYANSFLLSSDVTHAINPNFLGAYLENHAPQLNVGLCIAADANGHMTTDAVSTAILQRCADRVGAKLQVFQIRNDSRSGGTVGPMLSAMTGIRSIDAGIPQLSMHSIRATTGSLDPGLGVIMFTGFLNGFEFVDKEFRN